MPELIVLACLYNKNQKNAGTNSSSTFILYVRLQKQPEYFQVKQVGSDQSRLPDLTQPDKNFQFRSNQLPDLIRPMRSSIYSYIAIEEKKLFLSSIIFIKILQ
jgi:hypothetical protein